MSSDRSSEQYNQTDLTNLSTADAFIEDAVVRSKLAEMERKLSAITAKLTDAHLAFAAAMLLEIAKLSASVEILHQAQFSSKRSRAEQIQLDPLKLISRGGESLSPDMAGHFELELEDPVFSGIGWYEVQSNDQYAWRWSDAAGYSALVLPTLGGGRLRFSAMLTLPFSNAINSSSVEFLVQEKKVEVLELKGKGNDYEFECELELPVDNGLGQFVLLVGLPDGVRGNTKAPPELRHLGVGLRSFRLRQI